MSRPALLDLFCGAGGASVGYSRAGFDVTGVDVVPQPRYPFPFIQADALAYVAEHGHEYDAIHASPPCQAYVRSGMVAKDGRHADLLPATRAALVALGRPWIIENVPGAPMRPDLILCGSMFGLSVRRHRWFEAEPPLPPWTPPCAHHAPITGVARRPMLPSDAATWSWAMGIDWMHPLEIALAIPPAYTEYVGRALALAVLQLAAPSEAEWAELASGGGDYRPLEDHVRAAAP